MLFSIIYKRTDTSDDFETRFIHLLQHALEKDDKLVNDRLVTRYCSAGYYELEFAERKDLDNYLISKPNIVTEIIKMLDDAEVKEYLQLNNIRVSLTIVETTVQQTILSV